MNTATLTPRYTDYKSKAAVEEAFNANKDFTIMNINDPYCGMACNKADLMNHAPHYTHAKIRYAKNTKVTIVEIK